MKFPLYIALCLSLIFFSLAKTSEPRLENLGAGELCIYSREVVESDLISRKIDSGLGFQYYCDSKNAAELRALFNYIDGESIVLEKQMTASEVFRKMDYNEVSEGYGYNQKKLSYIEADGKKINLQVSNRGGVTVVGWPVILGSY